MSISTITFAALAVGVVAQGQPVSGNSTRAGLALRELVEGMNTSANGQPLVRVSAPAGSSYLMLLQWGVPFASTPFSLIDQSNSVAGAFGAAGVQGAQVFNNFVDPAGFPVGTIPAAGFQDLDLAPGFAVPPGIAGTLLGIELQALVFLPTGEVQWSNTQVRSVQGPVQPMGFAGSPALAQSDLLDWDDIEQGDVDGDGDLDIIGIRESSGPDDVRLWLAVAGGYAAPVTLPQFPPSAGFATSAELADFNNDGFLDLAVSFISNPANNYLQIWMNNGVTLGGVWNGFTALDNARIAKDPQFGLADPADIETADVDGDGDLDIYLACALNPLVGQQNRLVLNLNGPLGPGGGIPAFTLFAEATATNLPRLLDDTEDAEFFDFDNDGDQDIVVAAIDGPTAGPTSFGTGVDYVLINNGAGVFAAPGLNGTLPANPIPPVNDESADVVVFDMDRDGNPDLYFANWIGTTFPAGNRVFGTPRRDKLLRNNGLGGYVDMSARLPLGNDSNTDAEMADFDLDGDLDILVGAGSLRTATAPFTTGIAVVLNPGNLTGTWTRVVVPAGAGLDIRDLEPGDYQMFGFNPLFNRARWFDLDVGVAPLGGSGLFSLDRN